MGRRELLPRTEEQPAGTMEGGVVGEVARTLDLVRQQLGVEGGRNAQL